jgi:hypothetical protein
MKKINVIFMISLSLIIFISLSVYNIMKENKLNNEIQKIDKVLDNYFKNYLKCDQPETIEQYKSMINHYNLRVIRLNRASNQKYELLNEQIEINKLNDFCGKKGK